MVDAAGAIYVIGGYYYTTILADVWASTDGGARPDLVKGRVLGGYSRLQRCTKGVLRGTRGVARMY